MILGIGCDITGIARVEKLLDESGEKFLKRVFTKNEQDQALSRKEVGAFFAKRFSAKEACIKALGTGLRQNIRWTDIEITNTSQGKPEIHLYGPAQEVLNSITPKDTKAVIHVTLSDDMGLAQSFVVISTDS